MSSLSTSIRKWVRRRRLSAALVLAAVVAIVAFVVWRQENRISAADEQYVTAPVTAGTVARTVMASGTVNPVTIVQVGTYVSGIIQQITCDYNTQVHEGQLCAKIDPRPYQMVVDQDRANLEAAKAQLEKDQTALRYAQLTYQRNLDLAKRGIVSQDVLDQAKSTADQAKAQVALDQTTIEQRQAALNAAEINLGYTNIVSPVNGTVVSRNVTTGQTVAASFQTPTLFLIATDLTRMQVDASVSEGDIGGVTTGRPASFTVEAFPDRTFTGEVTEVRQAPQTVQNVVTYDVVVGVKNPDLLLKPGMTATVRIVTDERDHVVRVPDRALRFVPGGVVGTSGAATRRAAPTDRRGAGESRVWVLKNGHAEPVEIAVGLNDETNAEVLEGLQPGDRVIVSEKGAGSSPSTETRRPRPFGL
jgi:HlyD family secretion protein